MKIIAMCMYKGFNCMFLYFFMSGLDFWTLVCVYEFNANKFPFHL